MDDTSINLCVPAIINYAVGGLLITSVGAALIELYKAKKQPPKKNGKNPLSRKCSLADLTVMKHNRKELIRRDSILEVPEESSHLKQLGFIPPPLHRRCSYPVGPHTTIANSGLSHDNRIFSESSRKMSVVDSRRASVVDSRKTSVDYRNNSVDERRISVDDSPERRHHRLVHRH
ncbi:hypothetical protein NQ314_004333 [Rhamnusium bicolor]|uniref:Uncharacterized protein n=1 Tax=Rhamnusium bicolor TaxID=1586634 RepID=A0AAV8ZJL7_9CUCU|nr:hypothetical protein NQ314_004333 [Rhamnusium bicolor]